jgi:aminoglycoside phosphotransferase (APT) family kinase protein
MLEITLAAEYVPGTNVKGDASGANWMFLRPTLAAGHVLCVGMPRASTLSTLARLNTSVLVIHPGARPRLTVEMAATFPNLAVCTLGQLWSRHIRPQSLTMLFVAGWRGHWQLRRRPGLRELLRAALTQDAVVYYEYLGRFDPLRGVRLLAEEGPESAVQRFVLTPVRGELHTAIPEHDRSMLRLFRQRGLSTSPSLPAPVRGLARRARAWMASDDGRWSAVPASEARNRGGGPPVRRALAKAGRGWLTRRRRSGPLVERRGVLRVARASTSSGPPAYLRAIAEEFGVRLDISGWGLSAGGNYNSRKLVFYLTGAGAGLTTSRYIAKMVRDASFNPRLENEYRALMLLSRREDVPPATVPRAAFFGYHAGLAVIGETAIEGTPFATRTLATAACPYLHSAVEWLTGLAAGSAERSHANSEEAFEALRQLLAQFQRLYRPTSEQQRFLTTQVDAFRTVETPLPVTFQHGDPGVWNMLITDDGQIALLDWEAAESRGFPLWDLFYFLRSYAVGAARLGGGRHALEGVAEQLLGDTELNRMAAEAIARYCLRIAIPHALIEPLFYTCWVHRAVKEATRLGPIDLASGHYASLLQLSVARRRTAPLRRLFNQ